MPSPVPGYESLWNVLQDAFEQSASGKGKERHADDLPFDQQPIMSIGRRTGPGGTVFQLDKKAGEALGMYRRGQYDAAERELLGSIVYAAATIMLVREKAQAEKLRQVAEKVNIPAIPKAVHMFPKPALPIPDGVYYHQREGVSDDGYFHDAQGSYGQGTVFFQTWFHRRNEFPRLSD